MILDMPFDGRTPYQMNILNKQLLEKMEANPKRRVVFLFDTGDAFTDAIGSTVFLDAHIGTIRKVFTAYAQIDPDRTQILSFDYFEGAETVTVVEISYCNLSTQDIKKERIKHENKEQ